MEQFTQALSTVTTVLLFATFLATINERLVEKFIKPLLGKIGNGETNASQYTAHAALVTGALIAVLFGIDLFTPIADALGITMTAEWAGMALTAVLVGGGSNFIHDVWPGSVEIDMDDDAALQSS